MSQRRIIPNPHNASMAELDGVMCAASSHRERDRMRAIKALILRPDFEFVCELFNVAERKLRFWIRAFIQQGIDGLLDKDRPGRPRTISVEHDERLRDLLHTLGAIQSNA